MATKFTPFKVSGPWRGVLLDQLGRDIPPNAFRVLDEFHIHENRVMKYLGWEEWKNSAGGSMLSSQDFLNFGYDFELQNGTRVFLVGSNKHIYSYPRSGEFTQLNTTPFSATKWDRWQAAELSNQLFLVNGVDPIQVFDGVELKNLSSVADSHIPEAARYVENLVSHLTLAYTTESNTVYRQRVRWSKIDNPLVWEPSAGDNNEAGYFDFPQDLGVITGVRNLGPNAAIVYGTKQIYQMSYIGLPYVFSFERRVPDEGLFAPYSLASVNDTHFFLGSRDFYMFSGSLKALGFDRVIGTFWGEFDKRNSNAVYSFVHPYFNEVWWVYKSRNEPDLDFSKALIYNWQTDTWSTRGNTTAFKFTFLSIYMDSSSRTIAEATNTIQEAKGTFREKESAGNLTVVGGFAHGS